MNWWWICMLATSTTFLCWLLWTLLRRATPTTHTPTLPASRLAQAAGIHPWASRDALYSQMRGGEKEQTSDARKAMMEAGVAGEVLALKGYEAMRLDCARLVPGAATCFYSPSLPWLRGFVDALVFDGNGRVEGVVEIKTRTSSDPNRAIVPHQRLHDMMYHVPQCLAYLHMTGADYCDLVSFTPRASTVFRLRFDPDIWRRLVSLARLFLRCVTEGTPPSDNDGMEEERRALTQALCNMAWEPLPTYGDASDWD